MLASALAHKLNWAKSENQAIEECDNEKSSHAHREKERERAKSKFMIWILCVIAIKRIEFRIRDQINIVQLK